MPKKVLVCYPDFKIRTFFTILCCNLAVFLNYKVTVMEKPINVLLTGAAGTVGVEVMRKLTADKNIKLTVFDIKNARSKNAFSTYANYINIIWGDISNRDDVSKIPENLNVVIHLAAIIPPLADQKPELARKVNLVGTRNIIKTLEEKSPDAFLFYSSSISVYGDRVDKPNITVSDDINPGRGDYYAQTKIESEKLIRNSKLKWSVFRLTAIMKNHKMSKLMFHMPLNTSMEICSPSDTAQAFAKAIYLRDQLTGTIYNLGGGDSCRITYREFLRESFQIFGLGKLNFPEYAFAERNFHCGFYADGNELEKLLHFRNDTLVSYFKDVRNSTSPILRVFCIIFKGLIKRILLLQSEPYMAFRSKNSNKMNLYFLPHTISVLSHKQR